jgi:phospholipid/cholesterol/gamma-HCH transport system substrate-binding protein
MRDDRRNYIVVGVFVIAMVAGLVLWIAKISGRTGATDPYTIRYDAVLGVSSGTQIYFDGFPIGLIDSIEASDDPGTEQLFKLDVSIQRGWQIPEDSVAEITASSLLGAVIVNIRGGDSETYLEPGDQIPSEEATNMMAVMTKAASEISDFVLETLKPQIEAIVADLEQTMGQVNSLLSPQNTGRVAKILENLENVSQDVDGLTDGLGGTRTQVDDVLAKVDRVLVQVSDLIAENESELSASIVALQESLEAIARHADAIASNLEMTTRNMDEFSQQIRQNPGVIVRGRSAADEPAGSK